MEKYTKFILRLKDRRGVTVILVAILIVVLLGFVALAVDIGYVMVTKNELQNISDAASLAATGKLGNIYEGLTYAQQQSYVCNPADIVPVAIDVGLKNQVGKKNITINDADVIIGTWNPQTKKVEPNPITGQWLDQPDAVEVKARRDNTLKSLEGPITTFFAKIFGINTLDVSADATAALTGEGTADEGGLPIPLGISQRLASGDGWCGSRINMHPTKDSCAGWHTFKSKTSSSEQLEQILQDMLPSDLRDKKYVKDPPFVSPEVKIYNTLINFTGGDLAANFDSFEKLFDYMSSKDGADRDGDGDNTVWTTAIVIYEEDPLSPCGNPNDNKRIVGFATMKITKVEGPSGKTVYGDIICNYVDKGRGGGGNYGTKGSIPGLVE
jgi:Flp pilus assembly protein TadG